MIYLLTFACIRITNQNIFSIPFEAPSKMHSSADENRCWPCNLVLMILKRPFSRQLFSFWVLHIHRFDSSRVIMLYVHFVAAPLYCKSICFAPIDTCIFLGFCQHYVRSNWKKPFLRINDSPIFYVCWWNWCPRLPQSHSMRHMTINKI